MRCRLCHDFCNGSGERLQCRLRYTRNIYSVNEQQFMLGKGRYLENCKIRKPCLIYGNCTAQILLHFCYYYYYILLVLLDEILLRVLCSHQLNTFSKIKMWCVVSCVFQITGQQLLVGNKLLVQGTKLYSQSPPRRSKFMLFKLSSHPKYPISHSLPLMSFLSIKEFVNAV